MAISNQIFNAPTGKTYNPSNRIERSLSSLGDKVAGAITNESNRLQEQQANFNEMYSNLGEMDAQLQENYAGIMQEAVTSTRDWLKDQYKAGVNSSDPEFVRELSRRTSRIKAGMSSADRKREELTQMGEFIKANPNMDEATKAEALNYVWNKSNNPDYLISKNNSNIAEEVSSRFESPKLVVDNFLKTVGADGVHQMDFTGKDGAPMRREVSYNRFIPRDNPVNEDGSPNVQVSLDDAKNLMEGKYGGSMLRVVDQMRKERYPNDPINIGYQKAMTDALRLSAGNNIKTTILRSAYDVNQDRIKNNQSQQRINLAQQAQDRLDRGDDTEDVEEDRYSKFKEDFNSGKGVILGDYEAPGGNIKNLKWKKNPAVEALSSYDKWKELSEEGKKKILKELGIDNWWSMTEDQKKEVLGVDNVDGADIPKKDWTFLNPKSWVSDYGDLDAEETYNLAKRALENTDTPKYVGISFESKGGLNDGSRVWEPETIKINSEEGLKNAFKRLENLRVSGKGYKPTAEVPEDDLDEYSEFVIDQ